MLNEAMFRSMMELYGNPLFKKGFFDFFQKMQEEGIEAARKFWNIYPAKDSPFPYGPEIYEKMADFYGILGFVPKMKYDEVTRENEKLRYENTFLRDTIKQLQLNILKEGGEAVQETWKTIVDKQMEMNKEIAKNFFVLLRESKETT